MISCQWLDLWLVFFQLWFLLIYIYFSKKVLVWIKYIKSCAMGSSSFLDVSEQAQYSLCQKAHIL